MTKKDYWKQREPEVLLQSPPQVLRCDGSQPLQVKPHVSCLLDGIQPLTVSQPSAVGKQFTAVGRQSGSQVSPEQVGPEQVAPEQVGPEQVVPLVGGGVVGASHSTLNIAAALNLLGFLKIPGIGTTGAS